MWKGLHLADYREYIKKIYRALLMAFELIGKYQIWLKDGCVLLNWMMTDRWHKQVTKRANTNTDNEKWCAKKGDKNVNF